MKEVKDVVWSNKSDKSDKELSQLVANGKASSEEYQEWKRRHGVIGRHCTDMDETMCEELQKNSVAWPPGRK